MRKYSVLTATISALLLALISTPAHGNGVITESCVGGGTFTITSGVVSGGSSCDGAAVIPAGVTSIEAYAFTGATTLTSISIPATVTSIGNEAFYFNSALTTVTFVGISALKTIGQSAFDTSGLISINIPASVTSIGPRAFFSTEALTSITIADANLNYSILDGVLFNKNKTSLVQYPAAKPQTSYSIPASVTSIEPAAFAFSSALEAIIFDGTSTLTTIGSDAFVYATGLTSFKIPSSVTTIGICAFCEADKLSSITIPASVTTIGPYAFMGATKLTSVYFLASAPTVDMDAFYNVAAGVKAYIKMGAPGFPAVGSFWADYLTVAIGVYTASYNSSGGSPVASDLFTKNGAISQAPTQPTQSGYTFTGWSATDGGSALTFPYTPPSNSDLTLYATWSVSAVATAPVPIVANAYRADKLRTVYFAPLSSKLSKAAKKQIEAAVIANPSAVYKITGYVQKSIFAKNAKNDSSLSLARAKAIETHLESLGAGVTFTVVVDAAGVPAKNGKSDKARRATLYAMTPVVQ